MRLEMVARAILALKDHGPMSAPRLTALVRGQDTTVRDWLKEWERAGIVERVGTDPKPGVGGQKPTMWRIRT